MTFQDLGDEFWSIFRNIKTNLSEIIILKWFPVLQNTRFQRNFTWYWLGMCLYNPSVMKKKLFNSSELCNQLCASPHDFKFTLRYRYVGQFYWSLVFTLHTIFPSTVRTWQNGGVGGGRGGQYYGTISGQEHHVYHNIVSCLVNILLVWAYC